MNIRLNNECLKKTTIIFWTFWWLIALWTDITGALAHFKMLNASWAPDINYSNLEHSLRMYNVPAWLSLVLFIGILVYSVIATAFFCWASLGLRRDYKVWINRANRAHIVALTYWFLFFLADQVVMKFDLEQNHMVQGGFQLLTFFLLYLLPNDDI